MKRGVQNLLLVALAAAMMSFGWFGATGLVMLGGFVPMLVLAARYDRSARSFWKMFGWTALFITLWYAFSIWWVWYATPAGPIAATFFGFVYTGLPFMLWFFISKRTTKILSYTFLVSAWTVGEWFYNINQASFPWLNIGNGFACDIWLVQWYEWTGVYGGTIWVLVTNILIYEFLIVRRPRRWLAPSLAVLIPPVVSMIVFFTYEEPRRTAAVTIVQPNFDAYEEKFHTSQEEQTATLIELASQAPPDVDFIVMPETALHENIYEDYLSGSPDLAALREFMAERFPGAMLVVGANTIRLYGREKATPTARGDEQAGYYDVYNTALGLTAGGDPQIHHKSKLVIGVEMMPDWWWIAPLRKVVVDLGGASGHYGTDPVRRIFDLNGVRAGTAICYESIYGEYYGEFVNRGAELMFIITNDGWWSDSPGYRQHFNYARLRAVETRRAIARSANTGKSGFISTRGDVGPTLGWDVRGTITSEVPLNRRTTLYTRWGDYLCELSLAAGGGILVWFAASYVRRKFAPARKTRKPRRKS